MDNQRSPAPETAKPVPVGAQPDELAHLDDATCESIAEQIVRASPEVVANGKPFSYETVDADTAERIRALVRARTSAR